MSDMSVIDSSGQTTTSSSGQSQPWRLNYRGEYSELNSVCTRDLICWCFQIARGMRYLANRKVRSNSLLN